jgi:hypothetical protein
MLIAASSQLLLSFTRFRLFGLLFLPLLRKIKEHKAHGSK